MRIEISPMTEDDVDAMIPMMRDIDRLEFKLVSGGKSEKEVFDYLMARSLRARAVHVNGSLVMLYGIVPIALLSRSCTPWLVSSDAINRPEIRREFIKRTKSEASWLLDGFNYAWNLVHSDNKIAIRWLKWIGFRFEKPPQIIAGNEFLMFEMES